MVPGRIYKYQPFTAQTLANLKKRVWYFAPPKVFNDPFDCQFNLRRARRSAKELEIFRAALRAGRIMPGTDVSQFVDDPEKLAAFLDRNYEEVHRNISDSFEGRGVCCFSSRKESLLMWGHYADGHKGFCLEFEVPSEHVRKLHPVKYYTESPALSAAKIMAGDGMSAVEVVMCSKPKEWEYEEEWRMLHTEAGVEFCYGTEALTAIYFGAKMDCVNKELLALVLRGSQTKLHQSKLQTGSYSLTFEAVDYTPHPEAGGAGV